MWESLLLKNAYFWVSIEEKLAFLMDSSLGNTDLLNLATV
jgi:hypothetical protein